MDLVLSLLREISLKEKTNIYIMGKYICDELLGNPINSIEIALNNNIQDIINTLRKSLDKGQLIIKEENNFLKITHENKTTFFKFKDIKNLSIEEELKERLFTIDSMAIDIVNYDNIIEDNLIDPFNGYKDIKARIVSHNHLNVFREKPVNMVRVIVLMSEMDFSLSDKTKELIRESKKDINTISGEEVTKELFKILKSKKTHYYFKYMEELNILELIFPEINEMRCVGECKYHVVDVLTHSFYTLEIIESIIYTKAYFEEHIRNIFEKHSDEETVSEHKRLELIKLGAFFHDVGKPSAKKIDETGRTRFRGHEIAGAEIVKDIAERLGLSIKERDILYSLVSKHMIPLVLYKQNDVSGKALYKMFNELKEDTLDVSLIALADIIATRVLLDPEEDMGKFKIHIEYIINNYLTRFKEVENISKIITDKEIMMTFDLDEGVMIEDLIEELRKAIYNGEIEANKEAAFKYIEKKL